MQVYYANLVFFAKKYILPIFSKIKQLQILSICFEQVEIFLGK